MVMHAKIELPRLGSHFRLAGSSHHRDGVEQILEPAQAANFPDQSEQFVETIGAANNLNRLRHRLHLLDSAGVRRLLNRSGCRFGGTSLRLLSREVVTAFGTGLGSRALVIAIHKYAVESVETLMHALKG